MTQISVIFPYYMNPGMLKKQVDDFNAYPDDVKQNIELIIVDDGSPLGHRAESAMAHLNIKPDGYPFSLYRILTDLRWNWLEARNLGAKFAVYPWLLVTDIDHLIPSTTMEYLVRNEFKGKHFHTFTRTNYPDNSPYHPHPNSYFMTKKMYWRVGGYDETYAGNYGTDGMWRRRCEEHGSHHVIQNHPIQRVDRQFIPDASTTTLDRKDNRDPEVLDHIREYKEAHGIGIQTLRLPWKRII